MEEKTDRLFTGFPPVSTREWDAKIREDLKDVDYEKKLIWKTPEGFKVKPFYSAEDLQDLQYPESEPGCFPFVRGEGQVNRQCLGDPAGFHRFRHTRCHRKSHAGH